MDINQINLTLRDADSTKLFFTDLLGRPMSLSVNPEDIPAILEKGVGFDGSSIAGFASIEGSDRVLKPLIDTFHLLEFEDEKVGFFMCDIYDQQNKRYLADPRLMLEVVLERAEKDFGATFLAGAEHEFFLINQENLEEYCKADLEERVKSDSAGYFHIDPYDKGDPVRREIVKVLKKSGIKYEKSHHEVSESQHEVNLRCTNPLQVADETILFHYVTRKVAAQFGYYAIFIPKPFNGQNRNAFHIHLSMLDQNKNNLFYDPDAQNTLSETMRHFIGGLLRYARETSIVMAASFNSYKAYVVEREAPIVRSWGLTNRSCMVRIPWATKPEATRLELRSPDPSGNVYLQLATLLEMGLRGIQDKLACGEPESESIYEKIKHSKVWDERFLPKSMFEALTEAERSQFLKDIMGELRYEKYMTLKIADWEEHRTHITLRERSKYFDI
ncbi:MAG: glutamine synthetase [Planctomycetes bacterium]|nr:glutamine synthetase [Planctomycetota bacterium]